MAEINKRELKKLAKEASVRTCSRDCEFFRNGGQGCEYFRAQQVSFGELCLYDLVQMKKYADAFATNDNSIIKSDASRITGSVILLIQRMLQQVSIDGAVVTEPILDARGDPILIPDPKWNREDGVEPPMVVAIRIKDHPLISKAIQLAKSIGINLSEFKLTPKSADEKLAVSGHIVVEDQKDIKEVMKERKEIEDKFEKAIEEGDKALHDDPVYKKLTEDKEMR